MFSRINGNLSNWSRIIPIGLLLLLTSLAFSQTSTIRTVTSLPATCNGGTPGVATDEAVLVSGGLGLVYACTAPNTWSLVGVNVLGTANQINASTSGGTTTLSLANPTNFPGGGIFNGALSINSGIGALGLIPDTLCAFSFGLGSQDQLCNLNGELVWNFNGAGGTNYLIPWMKYYDLIGSPPPNGSVMYFNSVTGEFELLNGNTGSTQCLSESSTGVPSWGTCGGTPSFSAITSGTNATAAMLVGAGASLGPTSTGTIIGTSLKGVETTAPSGVVSSDLMYPDSTAHRWKMNNNNVGALLLPGMTTSITPGNCYAAAANGIDLVDGGLCGNVLGSVNPKSYGVKSDGKYVLDATFVSTSTTVTCPNSDCNFTSADVGKTIFGTANAQNGALILPQGTISSITNANSIVVSNAATGSATATGVLLWGTDDTTGWQNADAASLAACSSLIIPQGISFTSQPLFIGTVGNCGTLLQVPYLGRSYFGAGLTTSFIVPLPNFNFAGCTGPPGHACFFGPEDMTLEDFSIWGGGNSTAITGPKDLVSLGQGTRVINVDLMGWGGASTTTTVVGMHNYSQQGTFQVGGTLDFGAIQCQISGDQTVFISWVCSGGGHGLSSAATGVELLIDSTMHFTSIQGNYNGVGVAGQAPVGVLGNYYSYADQISGASGGGAGSGTTNCVTTSNAAAVIVFNASVLNCNNAGLFLNTSGSKAFALNTKFTGTTAGPVFISAGTTFTDQGGNTYAGAATTNSGTVFASYETYNTTSATQTGNVIATTMQSAVFSQNFRIGYNLTQIAAGSGCTTNTTIALNLIWQDPLAAGTTTLTVATATITTNGTANTPITSYNVPPLYVFRAKVNTNIQYSTTFTGGTCTTTPTYQITPILEAM